ncbi:MAG: hypothetical protein JKY96_07695 [Phycisphaerales bacterium]|nr:hypothetical protein [Phycisphaerales bacterium]
MSAPQNTPDEQQTPDETGFEALGDAPKSSDELHAWLIEHMEIAIPREALIDGHDAPFAYIEHAFFEDRDPRDCIVWANRGGGKTFLAAVATLLDMVFKPGIEIRILGGSLEQSMRMHAHLRSLFTPEPFAGLVEGKITQRKILLTNGSVVELLAQSQTSVRGTRVQKLRCDEVELFDRDVWEAAQLVTREKICGGKRVRGSIECLSTMHVPYGLMHELIEEAKSNDEKTRRVFRWGVVDVLGECSDAFECLGDEKTCPLLGECCGKAKGRDLRGQTPGHITIDDALLLKSRVSQSTWDAEMLCLRPQRSDCVLPEFDERVHVVDEVPSTIERWIGGMDFGIRAPTVMLWAGVDASGTVWVTREYLATDKPLSEHIAKIKEVTPSPQWIGVDPAGRQRSLQSGISDVQAMRKCGLTVHDSRVGLHKGIEMIRLRLAPASGAVRLYVHKRCEQLIRSLEQYHYPRDQPENPMPEKDGSDHAVDALRYMIQNLDHGFETKKGTYL